MTTSAKKLIIAAAIGGATLLSGCATGPYYDSYGNDRTYAPGYGYDYGYPDAGPAVGFGFSYSDSYDRRYYRGDRGYYRDRDGRDGWRDRDGNWHENGNREQRRGESGG